MERLAIPVLVAALVSPSCAGGGPAAAPSATATATSPSPSFVSPTPPATTSPSVTPTPRGTPVPAGFVVRSVSFTTLQRGWALGGVDSRTAGVAATTDGGRTWSLVGTIPVRAGDTEGFPHVTRVRFLTEEIGWVYGSEAYETTDGGRTWAEHRVRPGRATVSVLRNGDETYALVGVGDEPAARDAEVWYWAGETFERADAAGADVPWDDLVTAGRSMWYRTTGRTFRATADPWRMWYTRIGCADEVLGLAAAAPDELYVLCAGALRHSRDGGRTVTTRARLDGRYSLVAAAPRGRVVVAGPALRTSADGGWTFRTVPAPAGTVGWAEPRFVAGTSFGTVLRLTRQGPEPWVTHDGGATWRAAPVR